MESERVTLKDSGNVNVPRVAVRRRVRPSATVAFSPDAKAILFNEAEARNRG